MNATHVGIRCKAVICFPSVYLQTLFNLLLLHSVFCSVVWHFLQCNLHLSFNKPPAITKWTVPAIRATRTARCRSTTSAPGRACWTPRPCRLPLLWLVPRPDAEKPGGESWRAALLVTATRSWTSTRRAKNCRGPVMQRCVFLSVSLSVCLSVSFCPAKMKGSSKSIWLTKISVLGFNYIKY